MTNNAIMHTQEGLNIEVLEERRTGGGIHRVRFMLSLEGAPVRIE